MPVVSNFNYSHQAKPSQAKPSQAKPSQAKSSQEITRQANRRHAKSRQSSAKGLTQVYEFCIHSVFLLESPPADMSPCGEFSPSELTAYLRWYKKSCSDDDIASRLGSPTLKIQPPLRKLCYLTKLCYARVMKTSLHGSLLSDHGARRSRAVLSSAFFECFQVRGSFFYVLVLPGSHF